MRVTQILFFLWVFCAVAAPSSAQMQERRDGGAPPWDVSDGLNDSDEDLWDAAMPSLKKPSSQTTEQNVREAQDSPPLSAIEQSYTKRLMNAPMQFGYDLFGIDDLKQTETREHKQPQTTPPMMGAVQDDFVLGSGDTLSIAFTGQRSDQKAYKIAPRGTVIIDDLPPIAAAGKTIAHFRDVLNAQLSAMPNTRAYVSLESVRQINVLVVGHVKKPGRKTLSAFHSVLDVLEQAGGIRKDGSLRQIKHIREGHSTTLDLYALLLNGAPDVEMDLRDGDRLVIPPIGPTVAIAGAVKRPGIYEIREKVVQGNGLHSASETLDLAAMLEMAGGVLSPGANRFIRMAPGADGREVVTEMRDGSAGMFGDGAILSVVSGEAKKHGTVALSGHTRRPGLYDAARYRTLRALLHDRDVLGPDVYPLIGVIERWDVEQLATRYEIFSVRNVLKSGHDIPMQEDDKVILFSNKEIDALDAPETLPQDGVENGAEKWDSALRSFLKERTVTLHGAVRKPGSYPVADGVTLDHLIAVAGGLTLQADTGAVEVTSRRTRQGEHIARTQVNLQSTPAESISITAGDAIRISRKSETLDERSVLISGEVRRPGRYDLLSGERVSDLIARAGGITENAYPEGAIFSRLSERRTEERRFRAAAHDMQRSLAKALQKAEDKPDATQITLIQNLAEELETVRAVGRITVETDPDILKNRPELDMLLEKGDRLYIPKRPLTVRVSGEVLSPSSLQFISEKDPLDYIHEAGGFTFYADKDRAFVLYPDGSAQPLRVSNWNHKPIFIPPGSTIIVPRDPEPFSFIESAKEVGQILSNLAVTAVFIDDIRD